MGFCCGAAGVFSAGVGEAFGSPDFAGGGAAAVFALAAGDFGVGLAEVFVFAGTGTRITPLSGGMNWLGLFGSIV